MLYISIGTALAVSLPMAGPSGQGGEHRSAKLALAERVARRLLVEPTLRDAGIRLMCAGNSKGWQAIVDAAEMTRANRDTIAACKRATAKAKRRWMHDQDRTLAVRPP